MQISNTNPNYRYDDPVWYFLAEFSLSDFMSEHDREDQLTAGLLSQAVRELGVSTEYVAKIEMTLAGFAEEMLVHFERERIELPERVRVFCQKKMIDNANSARTISRPSNTKYSPDQARMIHHSGLKTNGGLGYFFIERRVNLQEGGSVILIDLYFYKEGK